MYIIHRSESVSIVSSVVRVAANAIISYNISPQRGKRDESAILALKFCLDRHKRAFEIELLTDCANVRRLVAARDALDYIVINQN